ncbi:hypothetical protein HK105_207826 [Polyrhizophydium stewartii]|uniref:Uncharacterized protein n=1 Tax=Polyrhizophydium stewartii TaxID=2732419 RepID=A0ABR4MZK9_9FUNG
MQPEPDPAQHAPAAAAGRNAPAASHWDRLPLEMRRAVLAAAGPLTQWTAGELADPTGSQVAGIWGDALALEWPLERLRGLPAAAVPAKTLLRETSPAALAAASRLRLHGHADDVAVAAVARGWLDWLPPEVASSPAALVLLAAAAGNTPLLEQSLAAAADPRGVAAEAAVRAAAMGHIEAVAAVRGVLGGDRLPPAVLDTAAAAGELPLVCWLTLDTGDPCTTAAMDGAAANGHLAVVEFLHENRLEGCTAAAMDLAATNGHLDVVVWLHTNRTEGCSEAAIDGAVRNGHVDVVKFLWPQRPYQPFPRVVYEAAFNGHTRVLEWAVARDPDMLRGSVMFKTVGAGGHIDTINWALANFPDEARTEMICEALRNLNIEIAEQLLGCRIEDSDTTIDSLNIPLIKRFMVGRDSRTVKPQGDGAAAEDSTAAPDVQGDNDSDATADSASARTSGNAAAARVPRPSRLRPHLTPPKHLEENDDPSDPAQNRPPVAFGRVLHLIKVANPVKALHAFKLLTVRGPSWLSELPPKSYEELIAFAATKKLDKDVTLQERVKIGVIIYELSQQNGVKLSNKVHQSLFALHSSIGDFEYIERRMDELRAEGVNVDTPNMMAELCRAYMVAGKDDKGAEIWSRLVEADTSSFPLTHLLRTHILRKDIAGVEQAIKRLCAEFETEKLDKHLLTDACSLMIEKLDGDALVRLFAEPKLEQRLYEHYRFPDFVKTLNKAGRYQDVLDIFDKRWTMDLKSSIDYISVQIIACDGVGKLDLIPALLAREPSFPGNSEYASEACAVLARRTGPIKDEEQVNDLLGTHELLRRLPRASATMALMCGHTFQKDVDSAVAAFKVLIKHRARIPRNFLYNLIKMIMDERGGEAAIETLELMLVPRLRTKEPEYSMKKATDAIVRKFPHLEKRVNAFRKLSNKMHRPDYQPKAQRPNEAE